MALPRVFMKLLSKYKKDKYISIPINPSLDKPSIGSPLQFGNTVIGEIKEVNDTHIIAVINNADIYKKFFKNQDPFSIGYKTVKEKDKK